MREALTGQGRDVPSALEAMPRAPDDELLAVALAEERILITEDRGSGELVFVRRLPHPASSASPTCRSGRRSTR